VCGGWNNQPRGQGVRCWGYWLGDGDAVVCMQRESPRAAAEGYVHFLEGDCPCVGAHQLAQRPRTDVWQEQGRWQMREYTSGRLVAEHVRYLKPDGAKTYVWRRDGSNGLKGLDETSLPLYGGYEWLQGSDAYRSLVIFCEGEKATDALRRLGLPAVGIPLGAPKLPQLSRFEPFFGARLMMWPDNDPPGRSLLDRLGQLFQAVRRTLEVVCWPEAPPKGDAADFVQRGGSREAVQALLEHARAWTAEEHAQTVEERFRRVGMDYRFAPAEAPVVLLFQRVRDRSDEVSAEVVARTGERSITRHVNLLAGTTRGAVADLVKELQELSPTEGDTWKKLLREGCEAVVSAHRQGRPFLTSADIQQRPAPPSWLCQGLLLKHKPNCWLGAASTGKSTLAKAMCAYYATGFRFCGREMERGVPLYLDWEDDHDSFIRVAWDVCHNLGVPLPPNLHWRDMHGYRLRDQIESIGEYIDRHHVGLLVLDAVAAAGGGAGEHVGWEDIALEMERCLGALPPVTLLALDHVTGEELKLGQKAAIPRKARGAVRKYEYLRNQWSLVTDEVARLSGSHVVNWYQTKNNSGPLEQPGFATEIVHREDEISIVVRALEVPEQIQDEGKTDQLLRALGDTWRTARDLALQVDGKEPTAARIESVRTLLRRAVEKGRAVRDEGPPVRYSTRRAGEQGVLISFPGGTEGA